MLILYHCWFEVYKDCSWSVDSCASFRKEGGEGIVINFHGFIILQKKFHYILVSQKIT